MTILLLLVPLFAFLSQLSFSDGGEGGGGVDGGGSAGGSAGAVDAGSAPPAGAGAGSGGAPSGPNTGQGRPSAAPAPISLRESARATIAARGGPVAESKPAAGGAHPHNAGPPAAPTNAQGDPFASAPTQALPEPRILEALEFGDAEFEGIPDEQLPLARSLAARIGQKWYTEKYEPAARELTGVWQQQQQWHAQLNQFLASEPAQLVGWLAQNPAAFAAVRQFLQSGGQAAAPTGANAAAGGSAAQALLSKINPATLDDESRSIFEIARTSLEQNAALQARMDQLSEELGQTKQWRESTEQGGRQAYEGQLQQAARHETDQALQQVSSKLGFDPRSYKREWKEALGYAQREIQARLWQWQQAGGQGPMQPVDTTALLWAGLKVAGFDRIYQRRQAQRRTSAPPPPDQAGRSNPVKTLEQISAEVIAERKAGRQVA